MANPNTLTLPPLEMGGDGGTNDGNFYPEQAVLTASEVASFAAITTNLGGLALGGEGEEKKGGNGGGNSGNYLPSGLIGGDGGSNDGNFTPEALSGNGGSDTNFFHKGDETSGGKFRWQGGNNGN